MARIVYITNGMYSTLHSSLELSSRLHGNGHEVTYISHVDLQERLKPFGYRFIQIVDDQTVVRHYAEKANELKAESSILRKIRLAKLRLEARKQAAGLEEICRVLKEVDPQVLLIDFEMHYAIMASHKLGIPTLLTGVWFTIFRSSGLPPMHTALRPPDTALARIRVWWAWWSMIGKRLLKSFDIITFSGMKRRFQIIQYGTNLRSDLKRVAKAQHFPFARMTSQTNWSKPHTYREFPFLIFNALEMELDHDQHQLEHYVGPMVCRKLAESEIGPPDELKWNSFVSARTSGKQKLIYCSLGSFWATDTTFVKKVIDAFRNRSQWNLVVGLGGKSNKADFIDVPDNVLLMDFAPQLKILQHCDAAITHGGITTINECISCGVPMLVCSTGYVDQPGCAARVQHHGLGKLLSIKTASAADIEIEIEQLLMDEDIQSRVDNIREIFERYESEKRAVKLIESLVDRSLG